MRVLVTGASGLIGGILWQGLAGKHSMRGIDLRADKARGIKGADVRKARSIRRVFENVEVVVDLAARPAVDLPWDQVDEDMEGRINVLEAARRHGIRRYVFASSNHVTGLYEREEPYASIVAGNYANLDPAGIPLIRPDWPIRPDTAYGVGKAFAEAAGRLYAEEHGISCLFLRIGTVLSGDRPLRPRHYATLLSHADLVRLVDCAVRAPNELRYGIYYGVSANRWRFWDLANAQEELGFEPHDDAERFRSAADC